MSRLVACLVAAGFVLIPAACSDDETTEPAGPGGAGGVGGGGSGGAAGDGGMAGEAGAGGDAGNGGSAGSGGCVNSLEPMMDAPANLSETGLYADIATKQLAPYVEEFTPQFPLWSDGADKTRWIYLPECEVIDNTVEDDWDFPVGTRVWKQFERDGQLIETRLIHRYGPGNNDFLMVTYRWDDLDSDAAHLELGEFDAKGTEHDIPTEQMCKRCHGTGAQGGWPARYLGFSAFQLSHAGSAVNMDTLSNDGRLLVPHEEGYTVPGTPVEQAALGYLHANCSNCHNDTPNGILTVFIPMRLSVADTQVSDTQTFTSLVDQSIVNFVEPSCNMLIDGNDPANSCVLFRMSQRGPDTDPGGQQMPPIATAEPDTNGGVADVTAWITSLP